MAQTYQVNYIVNVDAANAQTAINSFKRALASLDKATKPLMDLQRQVRSLTETMAVLGRKTYTVNVDTKPATKQIGKLIGALQMAQNKIQALNASGVTLAPTNTGRAVSNKKTRSSRGRTVTASVAPSALHAQKPTVTPTSYNGPKTASGIPKVMSLNSAGYKALGPTPLPNNGGVAIDMLKGMGIAYGIAGMGAAVSSIVEQASEYDNLMKTVENILKSHDEKGGFANRFASMSQTIRNVGMETKFKVTEVADAAKFLAMAGMDLEAIQHTIRPIADIALVGDTDLGLTADLVTNIMTGYNIKPDKMRMAADVMTNTFTMSNTTLTEIAEAYKYSASLLSAANVSFEEATAAIGVLGDAGIKGSQAGTTMRTIMANIANPTKKQAEAWNAIGIDIKKRDPKNLVVLFKELHDKNLDVSAYYKLFHKTAASGAVSLAQHVDKWDDVLVENRLAGGLSSRLADEKKNTLQGLWAQLMSVFVDNGVDAFNNVQSQLRELMQKAIDWMKYSPDFKKALDSISSSMMEFIPLIIRASEWFGWLFKTFGPLMKMWIKFQLLIWPIIKAISAFKSVAYGLLALKSTAGSIGSLAKNLFNLSLAANQATVATNNATGATVLGSSVNGNISTVCGIFGQKYDVTYGPNGAPILTTVPNTTIGQHTKRGIKALWGGIKAVGRNIAHPVTVLYPNIQRAGAAIGNRLIPSRQRLRRLNGAIYTNIGKLAPSAAMLAGGAAGYAAMDSFTQEDLKGWDIAAGATFSAASIAAMCGPWGLVAGGVLAAVGGVMKYCAAIDRATDAAQELARVNSSWVVRDGVLINENATGIIKWMQVIWQKHHDIREEVELRLAKTRELLGLESQNVADKTSIDRSVFQKQVTELFKGGKWVGDGPIQKGIAHLKEVKQVSGISANYDDETGVAVFQIGGQPYFATKDANYNDIAGNIAIIEEALTGKYRAQIIEDFSHRVMRILSGTSGDKANQLMKLQEDFEAQYGRSVWGKYPVDFYKNLSEDEWKKYGENGELATDRIFNEVVYNSLANRFGNPANLAGLFREFESARDNAAADLFDKFAALYDLTDERGVSLTKVGSAEWLDAHGFRHNTFIEGREGADTALQMVTDFYAKLKLFGLTGKETSEMQDAVRAIEEFKDRAEYYRWVDDQIKGGVKITEIPDVAKKQGVQLYEGFRYGDYVLNNGEWLNSPLTSLAKDTAIKDFCDEAYKAGGEMWKGYRDARDFENNPLPGTGKTLLTWLPSEDSSTFSDFGTKAGGIAKRFIAPRVAKFGGRPKNKTNNALLGVGGDDTGDSGSDRIGIKTSDYKSHVKERAIPKQININIQNLMKVDSVDLVGPQKEEVLGRLKREVAMALYEAAADGTMMLNNLATS